MKINNYLRNAIITCFSVSVLRMARLIIENNKEKRPRNKAARKTS